MDEVMTENMQYLLQLCESKVEFEQEYRFEMVELLKPTVLHAIFKLCQLDTADMEWVAMHVIDQSLVIDFTIRYSRLTTLSPWLTSAKIELPTDDSIVERHMKVLLPLDMAFQPSEVIQQHLLNIAQVQQSVEPPPPVAVEEPFDPNTISKDQLHQILLIQQRTKNILQ